MGFHKSNQGFCRPEELYHPVFQGGIPPGAVQYADLYVLFRWNSDRTCTCAGGLVKPSGKNVRICTGSDFQPPHYFSRIRVLYLDVDDGTVLRTVKLVLVSVWKLIGYDTLILISALQSIPKSIYEAALLDKAPGIVTFFKIILPMISPNLFFLVVMNTLTSFQAFETVSIMTEGGPMNSTNTLVYYIYQNGFRFYKMGYASAAGVVLLVLVGIMTIIYFKLYMSF